MFWAVIQAAKEKRSITIVTDPYRGETVSSALNEDGFFTPQQSSLKLSVPLAARAKDLSVHVRSLGLKHTEAKDYCEQLAQMLSNAATIFNVEGSSTIERLLWPAKIIDAYIPTFLIPIKAEWAKELFDETLAGQTLFGAKLELGLSREGVYYRAKTPAAGLKAPARILWYVSYDRRFTGSGHVRACSRLDDVIIDKPKNLYRRFRRLGIYDWSHVFDLAKQDLDYEIMALRFSDSELLTKPIQWNELQHVLRSFGCKTQIQSPVALSPQLFADLYRRGTEKRNGGD